MSILGCSSVCSSQCDAMGLFPVIVYFGCSSQFYLHQRRSKHFEYQRESLASLLKLPGSSMIHSLMFFPNSFQKSYIVRVSPSSSFLVRCSRRPVHPHLSPPSLASDVRINHCLNEVQILGCEILKYS